MSNPNQSIARALGVPHNPNTHETTDISNVKFPKVAKPAPVRTLVDMVKERCLRDPNGNIIFNPSSLVGGLSESILIIPPNGCALVCSLHGFELTQSAGNFVKLDLTCVIEGYATADGVQRSAANLEVAAAPTPVKGKRVITEL